MSLQRHPPVPSLLAAQRPLAADGIPSGFEALDALLPSGGWPRAGLIELLVPREGIGVLQLVLPALATLSRQRRWIAWVAPPYVPYAPALGLAGVVPDHQLMIHPRPDGDGLDAVERTLRSGTCGAVLAWPLTGDGPRLRRLQAAAEAGRCLGLLFRRQDGPRPPGGVGLRLRVERGAGGLFVALLAGRGGRREAGRVFIEDARLQASSHPQPRFC
ncbi:translesion DNA synthesis-associated protein ImuA [Thiohalobacter sp. IOR34]|uniref:translesion DNA synthesis-associated protein ImuA n=1 Tax=Thiohalobacter sp. IOR34 TaxID=3057176 RepID=UPI0025B20AC3|nr:translesion DNA synthesis-associated protein ImuA [Thiohalobacter sp. IOR34]WJW75112.1 translesion DNA synthesis-associated protein ImuA [Thiohalobacter sp. IOR34]